MGPRFYTNMVGQASRTVAAGIFIVGLLLIGFGVIIYALPKIFAILAAGVFSIAGLGCIATAVRIVLAGRKLEKMTPPDESEAYRVNVRIHGEEDNDA